LSGRLSVRQEPVELTPELAAAYGGQQMSDRLQDALREVRTLDVTARLGGTLQQPACQIRSTVGAQLAQGLQRVLLKELETRREEVARLVEARIEGEMARFEQLFIAKQQALVAKLQQNGADIDQLRQVVARQVPGLDRILDNNLPLDRLKNLPLDRLPADLTKSLPLDRLPVDLGKKPPVDPGKKPPVDIRFRF
jgi:hypothetical protein